MTFLATIAAIAIGDSLRIGAVWAEELRRVASVLAPATVRPLRCCWAV